MLLAHEQIGISVIIFESLSTNSSFGLGILLKPKSICLLNPDQNNSTVLYVNTEKIIFTILLSFLLN